MDLILSDSFRATSHRDILHDGCQPGTSKQPPVGQPPNQHLNFERTVGFPNVTKQDHDGPNPLPAI
ncbi:hypothetical protein Taro_003787 [Colocasia esculenta]|uniref:Uncharacterized protein n=1 Tax=Colocasia esculenta TaxID=4460 RepID=A0A843TPQ8_COLES|nr:hypothetical protein [Colocasia esculenta]